MAGNWGSKNASFDCGERYLVGAGTEVVVRFHISCAKGNGSVKVVDALQKRHARKVSGRTEAGLFTSSTPFELSSPFACANPNQNFGFPGLTLYASVKLLRLPPRRKMHMT